ncbi:hypothetical protein [Nonomuraea sp. NPDC049709]|uniref:hypothetical protein n=1 Tax=Nonomuraea sp. NPDC049709 TaxID=3154736 RepID=UPI003419C1E4
MASWSEVSSDIDTRRPARSSNSGSSFLIACDQTWLMAMIRSGVFGEGLPLPAEQPASAVPPREAATDAASLPKERRLRWWLWVDMLMDRLSASVRPCSYGPTGRTSWTIAVGIHHRHSRI